MDLKKYSFDFDGTLEDDFYGEPNNQKEEVQGICKNLVKSGQDVYIITKRFGETYKDYGKKNEHVEVYKLAEELGIPKDKVYFTDRDMKVGRIKQLGINVHFENSELEVNHIRAVTPDIVVVHVENPNWQDSKY